MTSLAAAFKTDWRGEAQIGETQEDQITAVYMSADESMYNGGKDNRNNWSSEGSQSSQMKKVGTSQI